MTNVVITGSDHRGGLSKWCFQILLSYMGKKAIFATPSRYSLDEPFDSLILAGGADIHPSRYGQESLVRSRYEEDRDQMEWEFLEKALLQEKPILGICRGMQMINVFFGGTLYQEVGRVFDDFLPPSSIIGKALARHAISVDQNSHLYEIIRKKTLKVNSLHHQAVDRVGKGLRVTAKLKNGVVQAIEHQKYPFIMGVQWHPELMLFNSTQRRFFL